MSAYVVDKETINLLVRAGLHVRYKPMTWYNADQRYQLDESTADLVGQMLLDECVHSVSHRYQDDGITKLSGPTNAYWLVPYKYQAGLHLPTPVVILKAIACYEYQSCEHPEWETSKAKAFCETLRKIIISWLPGYEEAPWGWDKDNERALNRR